MADTCIHKQEGFLTTSTLTSRSTLTFVEGSGSVAVDCSIIGTVESVVPAVDGGADGRVQATTPT
jgi:hypothetical protein